MAAQPPPSSTSGNARSPDRIVTSPYQQHQPYYGDSTATRRYLHKKSESQLMFQILKRTRSSSSSSSRRPCKRRSPISPSTISYSYKIKLLSLRRPTVT